MSGTTPGLNQQRAETLQESVVAQNDMLLELLLELKIANLHAAELSESAFEQEDVELEIH